MGHEPITVVTLFLAGLASFFSPCVLPVVPVYLSLVSGMTFEELRDSASIHGARWRLMGSTIAFVLGFAVVITLLAVLLQQLDRWNEHARDYIRIGGGVLAVIFALQMFGAFRITALMRERRFHPVLKQVGYLGALILGAAFAFGWVPCIAPLLTAALAMTASAEQVWLISAYIWGLALPFLVTATFASFFLGALRKVTPHLRRIEIGSGILLLVMGALLVTDKMEALTIWFSRLL